MTTIQLATISETNQLILPHGLTLLALPEDAFVVNTNSSSPSNSVQIQGNTGPTDVMMTFPSIYTSGKYEFSMKFFVTTGRGGYFNIQETQTAGQGWKLDVFFSSGGSG